MVQGAPIGPLRGEFAWSGEGCIDADEATTGELRLFVGGRLVWGVGRRGVNWHWIDLLEGLVANWGKLLYGGWLEPGALPANSAFTALEDYEAAAMGEEAIGDISPDAALQLQDAVFAWAEEHLISRFMPGVDVPDIAVWAEGPDVFIESVVIALPVPRGAAAEALGALGDAIALRLRQQGFANHPVVVGWESRSASARDDFAATVIGEAPGRLAYARGDLMESAAWGGPSGEMANTPCLAAAAACRELPGEILRDAVQAAARIQPASPAWLDCLEAAQQAYQAAGRDTAGFELELASSVRGNLGLKPSDPLPIASLVSELGMVAEDRAWELQEPAGIAVCAPAASPHLLFNASLLSLGRQAERRWVAAMALAGALRASLAGEPWSAQIPLPRLGEDRLALELLCPVEGLQDFILGHQVTEAVRAAWQHYGAPPMVVAMQLQRSAAYLGPTIQEQIKAVLSSRQQVEGARPLRVVAGR